MICEDTEELAAAAAELFVTSMCEAVAARGRFTVALAGGSTPKRMYELLAERYRELPEWERTFVFFGDERSVGPEHEESNYRMACEALLDHVALRKTQVFRMESEREDRVDCAFRYQQALGREAPVLDLVLLGLGEDGHTASIFADYPDKDVPAGALVAAVYVSGKDSWRMTLTPAAINSARRVVFLVGGENKRAALRDTIEKRSTPASRVAPESGELTYLVDRAAAGELAESTLKKEFLDESG